MLRFNKMDYDNILKAFNRAQPSYELSRKFTSLHFYITGNRHNTLSSKNPIYTGMQVPLIKFSSLVGQAGKKLSNALLNFIWTYDSQSFYITEVTVNNTANPLYSENTSLLQTIMGNDELRFSQNLLKFTRYWIDYGNAIMILYPESTPSLKVYSPLQARFTCGDDDQVDQIFVPRRAGVTEETTDDDRGNEVSPTYQYLDYYVREREGLSTSYKYYIVDLRQKTIELQLESPNRFFFLSRMGDNQLTYPYGQGKGCNVIGDVASLNSITQLAHMEANYAMNPALLIKDASVIGNKPLKRTVGSLIAINSQEDDLRKTVTPLPRTEGGSAILQYNTTIMAQAINSINEEYLINDISTLARRSDTTATEVQAQEANKLSSIKPLVEALYIDLLTPLLRTMLYTYGNTSLNTLYKINYTSSAARIGELKRLENNIEFIQIATQMAQIAPQAPWLVKVKELLQSYTTIYNIPEEYIRTDREIAAILKSIQQIAEAAQTQTT